MNKLEHETVANVIHRLRGERASAEIAEMLTGPCRLYLETWVIPALELLIKEERTIYDLRLAAKLSG